MPDPVRHVSDTAFLVAQHRALESARPDALFSDPLAARLAGEQGRVLAASLPSSKMIGWQVAVRTPVIDDLIRQAIARGVDVIINLGAGLDTRPYRLELPATLRWIEVDFPDVIAFKTERLAGETPRCRLERIGLDLAQLPARRELLARLDAGAGRALILTEGVVPYLDNEAAGALADDLRALHHVDGWIVDYFSPEVLAYRRRAGADMKQAPFKFQPPDWFGFFARHGWRSRETRYLPVEAARLGRRPPLPWPVRVLTTLLWPVTPPARRKRMAEFSAYVLLEPAAPMTQP
jgi:methyltransferase (TIGR00027 family)